MISFKNQPSRTGLQNTSNGLLMLTDVSCTKKGAGVSGCNARIMDDKCNYNQRVWLNCNNDTGYSFLNF